ncbi:formate dehydrogenase [Paucibacter sp. KBW04]|uniref:formate dehydrogenase subunit delta n=1 Tax=Paucibacter sp. KBW04 TaxID=2153361 RepID=UPI000F5868E2|nr:formate dehydrogenase subunit delta [Paucibacter sp. KBW04]RQO61304.1 formate dehydrogenase [Paucibacter sp. KBW04]
MNIQYLTQMANSIGEFFQTMPNVEEAEREVVQHLRRFWDPRMREQLLEHLDAQAGTGLLPFVKHAVLRHRQDLNVGVNADAAKSGSI